MTGSTAPAIIVTVQGLLAARRRLPDLQDSPSSVHRLAVAGLPIAIAPRPEQPARLQCARGSQGTRGTWTAMGTAWAVNDFVLKGLFAAGLLMAVALYPGFAYAALNGESGTLFG